MKYSKKLFILLSAIILHLSCISQNVDGHWFGTGNVEFFGNHNQYLVELILRQNGKKINGELGYYFKDGFFLNPIKGSFDVKKRLLILNEFPFIHFASKTAELGFTTNMTGEFHLRSSRVSSILTGIFKSDEIHKFTSPIINFTLYHSNDTIPAVLDAASLPITLQPFINKDLALLDHLIKKDTITFSQKKTIIRSKKIARELTVNSSLIKLEFYDSGEIDYDSISVYQNNKLLLPKSMLNYDPLKITIRLDEKLEYTDITMFANNVGLVSPNSAVLILYDGKKRYEIEMNSDFEKSATIRLRKRKNNN